MARFVRHRSFTLPKAVALVALMAASLLMGGVPHPVSGEARMDNPVTERVVPALFGFGPGCDPASKGVSV
ncbi:hypothetical protein [Tropicibacter sp. S64]|uniref:hypothetical protein n=1 Tax=Tropicibacter sp. S64 TaxID=3415122 RepID=UPI003C7A2EF2